MNENAITRAPAEREYQRLGEELAREKRQWQSMVDAMLQLVCELNEAGQVVRTNRTVETWGLGTVSLASGVAVHDLLHPHCGDWHCELRTAWEQVWQSMADKPLAEFELFDRSLARDLEFSLRKNAEPESGDGPEAQSHVLLVIDDVTGPKRAARALEDLNRELQRGTQEKTRELARVKG